MTEQVRAMNEIELILVCNPFMGSFPFSSRF